MAVKERVNGVLNGIENTENRIKNKISKNKNSIIEKIKTIFRQETQKITKKTGISSEKIKKKVNEKKILRYLIYFIIGVSFLLLFKKLVVIGILLIITTILGFFIGLTPLKMLGAETAALTAVIAGMLMGPAWGFVIGSIAVFIHLFAVRNLNFYLFWVIPGYGLIGLVSGIMTDYPVQIVGIALIVALNLFFLVLTLIASPTHIMHFMVHVIGNIIFNYILFTTVAPFILILAGV